MLVTSRVHLAWKRLAELHEGTLPGEPRWVAATQTWFRDVAPVVAPPAARILRDSAGVRLLLDHAPEAAPISRIAAAELGAAVAAAKATGPEVFARQLCDLAFSLAVFHDDDLCCDTCQYTMSLWQDGDTLIWVCGLGHSWRSQEMPWQGERSRLTHAPRNVVVAAGLGRLLCCRSESNEPSASQRLGAGFLAATGFFRPQRRNGTMSATAV